LAFFNAKGWQEEFAAGRRSGFYFPAVPFTACRERTASYPNAKETGSATLKTGTKLLQAKNNACLSVIANK